MEAPIFDRDDNILIWAWADGIAIAADIGHRDRNGKYPVKVTRGTETLAFGDVNLSHPREMEVIADHCNNAVNGLTIIPYLRHVAEDIGKHAAQVVYKKAVRITANTLLQKTIPDQRYIIEDVLPAGCTVLAGKSKDGKSLMVYNMAIAVASNGKVFGRFAVDPGHVWYLALEDGERRGQKRLKHQIEQFGELSDEAMARIEFTFWDAPRIGEGLEEDLKEWITTTPQPRLVIIDILEKVRPPRKYNGNLYTEDYEATSSITQLAQEHNVAVLIVHHSNKLNPTDFRDSASGAMSLIGGADNFWSLNREAMSEKATLKITGRDIEQEQDLAMQFKDGFWTVLGDAALVSVSKERQQLIDVLKTSGFALGPKDIATLIDKNYSTTKALLAKMTQAGILYQPVERKYMLSPAYTSIHEEAF